MTDLLRTDAHRPLILQGRFWPIWVMLSFGTFADNVLRQSLLIGIPAGVIDTPLFSNPDDAMPFIGALLPIAILTFSSVSGQLADKFETAMMFRRTKATEIILMCAAALAFSSGFGGLAIAMLFAMGAQSAFFSPVRVSAMPKYLAPNELVRGNGLCNAGLFSFILLGYVVGGFLIVQENGGIFVGGVLIAAAFVGWAASLRAQPAAANDPDLKISFNAFAQTWQMFAFVFRSRGVPPALIGVGAFFLMSTAVTVVIPLYGRDALHADPLVWTALNGLFAVGAGLGAIVASNLPKERSNLGVSAFAILMAGMCSIGLYFYTPFIAGDAANPFVIGDLFSTPGGIILCAIFIATSGLAGVYIAPLQAAMQRRAPAKVRARIMAAGIFTNAAFAIPGSLSVLAITKTGADPALAFVAVGAAMLIIAGVMFVRRHVNAPGLYDEILQAASQE